jgi:hypothetical protein
MSKIDYKKIRQEKFLENKVQMLSELETPELSLKIQNWAERHGYTPEAVKEKILTDEMFRCNFLKDPAKQNYAEKAFEAYLKTISQIINPRKLPGVGKNSLYVKNDGSITTGLLLEKDSLVEAESTKSIDFEFEWKSKTCHYKIYCTHKLTTDEGGAQDNQHYDAIKFMKNAKNNTDQNVIFLAILDGDYYLQGHRLDVDNKNYGIENKLLAMTSDHLEGFLELLP